jgi:hypothetical protein
MPTEPTNLASKYPYFDCTIAVVAQDGKAVTTVVKMHPITQIA